MPHPADADAARRHLDSPRPWRLTRGATVEDDGAVTFSVWCPRHASVHLRLGGDSGDTDGGGRDLPMERDERDVFRVRVAGGAAGDGTDYRFVLPGIGPRPDPVSRFQPDGVHGPSRVVAPGAFSWTDGGWTGIELADHVLYELHVGTFTPDGTFDGVRRKLDHLGALGVTAVELMPVAAFPGARNWGYDGAALYAPHVAYGGPAGLKRLVDACHASGLAVVLDVVYNHFGPEGSYVGDFGPYFTDCYRTPWGGAINFDGRDSDDVRRFFVDNALHWLTEYHVDGLRLDAVHGIFDGSPRHFLAELGEAFHAQAARLHRRAHLFAESDLNDVRMIRPRPPHRGGQGGSQSGNNDPCCGHGMDAQWSDDFHHALHALLTGAARGYFSDFGAVAQLGKAMCEGFVYDGQWSRYRRRRHGTSSAAEPAERLVHFQQNHDQIANAYQGRRLSTLVSADRQKVAAALLLLTPGLPMLFMGEEMAETAPFHYFTSHTEPELARAVREGRHAEYLHLIEESGGAADLAAVWADPQAEETFRACRLRWELAGTPARAEMLAFYRELIALRRRLPALGRGPKSGTTVRGDEAGRWLIVERAGGDGPVVLLANLGEGTARLTLPAAGPGAWRLLLGTRPGVLPAEVAAGATVALPADSAAVLGPVAI